MKLARQNRWGNKKKMNSKAKALDISWPNAVIFLTLGGFRLEPIGCNPW
jgi:hypothetical protein